MKQVILFILIIFSSAQVIGQDCATTGDRDGDGICDPIDPCPDVFNTGDDNDGDNVLNECDNSPLYNPDQADIDNDGIGDVSDPCVDPDGDGVCGSNDKCPGGDDNVDIDRDGIPDDCDSCIDEDRDDICDDEDDCINSRAGSSCDDRNPCTVNDVWDQYCNCNGDLFDTDGDGVCDLDDVCPGADDTRDFDGDGIPDACDDSPTCTSCIPDESDKMRICHFYLGGNLATIRGTCAQLEKYFDNVGDFIDSRDHCGPCTCADAGDVDSDGDGICDKLDPCPNDANDSDNDGVCDSMDVCPGSDDKKDSDADGIPDGCDELEYCSLSYTPTWEWISKIELDGIPYSNGQSSSLSLYNTSDYKLEKGVSHMLEVTPEYIDDIRELSTHIYIDLNADGDFEDNGELLHESRSLESAKLELKIDNWEVGTYRMRVVLHYGRIHGPCQEGIEGEIEDLLIEVIGVQSCMEVSESFEYDMESGVEALSGGNGWTNNWEIGQDDASSQVSILEGSLGGGTGNRLGLLNAPGTEITLSRSLNANLSGSTTLSFSMLLERISGSGAVEMELGELNFGVSSSGSFYLEEASMGEIVFNETTELFMQIQLNTDGAEDVQMWINPGATLEAADALSVSTELGSKIESLDITISSDDSFIPSVHYIDEIRMGCDDNFEKKRSSSKRSYLKKASTKAQLEISSEMSVWPNPIMGGNTNVMIQGKRSTYQYEVTSLSGVVVSQGYMLPGLNRLQLESLSSGIYYMTVDTENGQLTKKLIF